MSFWTDLRDAGESAAVVAGNYFVPGSSLITSHLTSQGSQDQLNSGIGQLAQLGSGGYGYSEGNGLSNLASNLGISSPSVPSTPNVVPSVDISSLTTPNEDVSGLDLGGQGASPGPVGGWNNTTSQTSDLMQWAKDNPKEAAKYGLYGLSAYGLLKAMTSKPNYLQQYTPPTGKQYGIGSTLGSNYQPVRTMATGGITNLPVEDMSNDNSIGKNTGYPQADITQGAYATPWQTPVSRNMLSGSEDIGVDPNTDQMSPGASSGGISGLMNYAQGGSIGGYSDGGQMLKGPGDGMSDSIPGTISGKQPARLADGEFVVPADVVSHLGNGSTDAGAKQLYSMMNKVRQARTGRKAQGRQINPGKYLPV